MAMAVEWRGAISWAAHLFLYCELSVRDHRSNVHRFASGEYDGMTFTALKTQRFDAERRFKTKLAKQLASRVNLVSFPESMYFPETETTPAIKSRGVLFIFSIEDLHYQSPFLPRPVAARQECTSVHGRRTLSLACEVTSPR